MRLDVNFFDYTILAIYFVLVVGIGVMARRAITWAWDEYMHDLREAA